MSQRNEPTPRRVPRESGYYHSERVQRPSQSPKASQPPLRRFSRFLQLVAIIIVLVIVAIIAFFATRSTEESSAALETSTTETTTQVASFTTADAGSCLTWDPTEDGIENFEQTDCANEHRFEVSSREDLSTYPASEFGRDAAMPDTTRQAQLREELCLNPTIQYLDGLYDSRGRYSVASILPPTSQWEAGDRTLLCGVQVTDEEGNVLTTTGRAQEQDQARIFNPGDCIQTSENDVMRQVACESEHTLEVTSVVDLQNIFPDTVPTVEEQDTYLQDRCTEDARAFLGSDDALYHSTLTPFWIPLEVNSWESGSHSVNCALIAAVDGQMGTLVGSALGEFTINGAPPAAPAERDPVVNPDVYSG
ncbi:MAG: septum formation family protein [Corynebacterium sp.]|nr:septum formation family protein [Corynebacterium sp.]